MGLLNAHIFGRRRRGDREEVRIQFYNEDGTPLDLSSGGGDGGSTATSVYLDFELTREAPVPSGMRANAIVSRVRTAEGISVAEADEDIQLPAGVYLVNYDAQVWTTDGVSGTTDADGSWIFGNYTTIEQAFYIDNRASGVVPGYDGLNPRPFSWPGGVFRVALNNDYEVSDNGGIEGQIRISLVRLG